MGLRLSSPVRREALRREIRRKIERLPSPPTVVIKLLHLAEDESVSARDLEPYFRADQSLTTRLLKLANSSFFGVKHRINTIPEAIALLGFRTLRSIVLAAFFSRMLPKSLLAYGYGPGGLWKHSLGVAMLSRELGSAVGCTSKSSEELYVGGLLHDIGKIVLGEAARTPKMLLPQQQDGAMDVTAAERQACGIDHAQVGQMVAERWRLSPMLAAMTSKHHDRRIQGRQLAIVHLADQICVHMRLGIIGSCDYPMGLAANVFDLVGIKPAQAKQVADQAKPQMLQSAAIFTSR